MRRTFSLLVLMLFMASGSFAQKDALKVLFVGNSYTFFENLPQMVTLISEQTGKKLIARKSTIGGAKLREHWHGERGLKTKEMIEKGQYDIVVLQEHSMGAVQEPDSLHKYGALFCELIKANGAKPYFYQTWAREKMPLHQETINRVYNWVAAENGAIAVPVGTAWATARYLRPDLPLYNPDGSHPAELGTFLTACVFVAAITNELPEKLPSTFQIVDANGETVELMRLDALDITFCQEIVHKVVFNCHH